MAALVGSLAGDAFLMVEGFFIPGLVSFLLAHLAYIALFKQGVPWFAHRGALAATVGVGAAMYLFLWQGGLPPELRVPVAVYVLVIALMAAQTLARFHGDGPHPEAGLTIMTNGGGAGVMAADEIGRASCRERVSSPV